MAIINSVLTGKVKGKIGNVCFSQLKGQTIVKTFKEKLGKTDNVLQNEQRGRMSNAVRAWQLVSALFTYMYGFSRQLESNYNAFVRIALKSITELKDAPITSIITSIKEIFPLRGNSNWGFSNSVDGLDVIFYFDNSTFVYKDGYRIDFVLISHLSSTTTYSSIQLSPADYNNSLVTVTSIIPTGGFSLFAVMSSTVDKKNTDLIILTSL